MKKRFFVLFVLAALIVGVAPIGAQDEETTLVVWDNWFRDAEQEMIETLNAEFEEAHPGVTIQRESYTTDDLTDLIPLALSEENGPDVTMINQGFTGMGALVEAGLLLPLDDYADEYGWWDRYGMSLHKRNMFSEDGQTFGEGNLYGVSYTAEVVAVYYWKEDFEALGLEIPQTLEAFEAVAEAFKDEGIVPLMFGSLDGWPAIHNYSAIQHSMLESLAPVDDFIFRREGATFDTQVNLLAAQKFVEWANSGYFPEGFAGIDYDEGTAMNMFVNHEAAMWLTGSWMTGSLVEELGEEPVGFFLFPPSEADKPPFSVGGVGLAYGIRATSEHADLAAEYIDLVTGSRAAELLLSKGFLPAAPVDSDVLTEGTLTADTVNAWNTASSQNAIGHYLDWVMPDIAAHLQELLAGVVTPEEFVADVDAKYQAILQE